MGRHQGYPPHLWRPGWGRAKPATSQEDEVHTEPNPHQPWSPKEACSPYSPSGSTLPTSRSEHSGGSDGDPKTYQSCPDGLWKPQEGEWRVWHQSPIVLGILGPIWSAGSPWALCLDIPADRSLVACFGALCCSSLGRFCGLVYKADVRLPHWSMLE